ncbi:hypothetical protein [Ectothiorhodospira sp. BSL-9]|uniref:hypothetical protein n=1 Tax=Ectothiorhodospira sp. BSL-9 TaxID=1442136 RepID=UPI0007B43D4D|nr:hypothetical protein [Ectothiorhodospira sp. BSL-9]ANB01226.1 hypothetical protein ECTOBSL9_0290 [Ectothiorhodospira sp. BSL-9]TVQ72578.1 MAG: hypothetical protein EA372_07220 [Chromatiaceae bacterium]
MDKKAFAVDTQYAVTLRDATGRLRPANLYVHQLFDQDMIARRTDGGAQSGLLFKIPYKDVARVVRTVPVSDKKRFMLPEAMLKPKLWENRSSMAAYSSSPGLGK